MINVGEIDWLSHQLVGRSPEFEAVLNATNIISKLDVPVLLLGENGTGKELFARAIHNNSSRHDNNFVAINCAAIPEALFESELFGFRKGSFTHAEKNYDGKIRAAHNGTLFLDEIAELSLTSQAKLLRFLETSECQSLGQQKCDTVNVRVIAATNQNLPELAGSNQFRKDLYYRLNVVPVNIPPLRERSGDIPMLMEYFTHQFSNKHKLPAPKFDKAAIKQLTQYPWPGNVREARNLCERMVVFHSGKSINPALLPPEILASGNGLSAFLNDTMSLAQHEKQLINSALNAAKGNQSKAARLLGITRDTLIYRIKKYQIKQSL
ncbi:MAG: sigma-54 dependent transcriptional regulator [Gammaproteobacteria bacterium]|nr:sigma-54 dependent transcriptional regulator [Gammaproteobacteria bacterium]MDH5799506.1 sigma-54 dependent transcriptional regulator [Gammaproteobacteria bacterium]